MDNKLKDHCNLIQPANSTMNSSKDKSIVQTKKIIRAIPKSIEMFNYYNRNEICILNLDMTFDDRMFFGKQNYWFLNHLLARNQCYIDFAGPDNKVSIMGPVSKLRDFCKSFYDHSTFAFQFEFQFYTEKQADEFLKEFELFQKEHESKCIYISYFRQSGNLILFKFLSFRKYFSQSKYATNLAIIRSAIFTLQEKLEKLKLGKNPQFITSTLQIPVIRRDSHVINIENIEKETKTRIKIIRYNDCPKYLFENVIITGDCLNSVLSARQKISAGFNYELMFHVPINNVDLLVENISKLNRNSVSIKIHPADVTDIKIISFKCQESSMDKLFILHDKLLKSMGK